MLANVRRKLARIPFAHESTAYNIFVCDDDWRWSSFTLLDTRSAAVARSPLSRDVIVRAADFTQNRYRQASGTDAPADRPLDYLLAHELTHLAVTNHLGVGRALRLPIWVREGYADYIARGPTFDHAAALRAEHEHAGRYAGHALLVAHLLEREGWSVEALLTNPPAKSAVEARARF